MKGYAEPYCKWILIQCDIQAYTSILKGSGGGGGGSGGAGEATQYKWVGV